MPRSCLCLPAVCIPFIANLALAQTETRPSGLTAASALPPTQTTPEEAPAAPVQAPSANNTETAGAASSTPAQTASPSAAPPPPPETRRQQVGIGTTGQTLTTESQWYGWHTLTLDGASFLTFGAGITVLSNGARPGGQLGADFLFGSLALYLLGGPVVHFVHANPGRGFGSFGLRLGMPVVLGSIGGVLTCRQSRDEFCALSGVLLGGGLGIVGAITIDAALLAREDKPTEEAAVPHFYLSFARSTAQVSASGTF